MRPFPTAVAQDSTATAGIINEKTGTAIGSRRPLRRLGQIAKHRTGHPPRISWAGAGIANYTSIQSFKHLKDKLWFRLPGDLVSCDVCSECVPQCLGSLHGDPKRSIFAQDTFLCTNCSLHSVSEGSGVADSQQAFGDKFSNPEDQAIAFLHAKFGKSAANGGNSGGVSF